MLTLGRKISEVKQAEILSLHHREWSVERIAAAVAVSVNSVRRVIDGSYENDPWLTERYRELEAKRCPGCGAKTLLPCLRCEMERK